MTFVVYGPVELGGFRMTESTSGLRITDVTQSPPGDCTLQIDQVFNHSLLFDLRLHSNRLFLCTSQWSKFLLCL
ncbi:heat shock 22kDa protein 8, isoform CRA_c [Rattus norvegicus]|uniref:Heat shock 22kDa protein 8, isoform CRA_c n=1 Tax=Rattus norvegicus TaxID=10116 RepID=A6J1Q7_RAT|nr:heat shock 22kDa protein 8, isoform CRA_c [Rattus norvegicus]